MNFDDYYVENPYRWYVVCKYLTICASIGVCLQFSAFPNKTIKYKIINFTQLIILFFSVIWTEKNYITKTEVTFFIGLFIAVILIYSFYLSVLSNVI